MLGEYKTIRNARERMRSDGPHRRDAEKPSSDAFLGASGMKAQGRGAEGR